MVTGGVIIVSTLLSYFTPQKPARKEIASVVLAYISVIVIIL